VLLRTGCCPDEEYLGLQRLVQLALPSLQELVHPGRPEQQELPTLEPPVPQEQVLQGLPEQPP
jgi:hypothetical protein